MYRFIPLRVLRRTIAANSDLIVDSDIPKIDTIITDLNEKNGHPESDKIGTVEIFNPQYYLDYKEFKRNAAAERSLRGKDFVEKN